MFTIQTRWEAEKIRCFPDRYKDKRRLHISWKEKGVAEKKVIRLWNITKKPSELFFETFVNQDEYEVTLEFSSKDLISGNYLIHLEPYDPWITDHVCPHNNAPNTKLIEIITQTPKEDAEIKHLCIDAINMYPIPIGTSYIIRVRDRVRNIILPEEIADQKTGGVLVTPYNEDWYMGDLEVTGEQIVIDLLEDTNPVKFEYDPQKLIITSIEDRYGDGAMYCHTCRMLFWSQETVEFEKKRGHRNYGPIVDFRISWIPKE